MFKLHIYENQKGLVYKDEKLIDVLGVGTHKLFRLFQNIRLERIDTASHGIDGEKARTLYRLFPDIVKAHFYVVSLKDEERAYVSIDGKFTDLMEPGELKLYFKELDIAVERVNIKEHYTLTTRHRDYIDMFDSYVEGIAKYTVTEHETAYLYRDEVCVRTLQSGRHYFYTTFGKIELKRVDTRIKELEINGQELLSADKVTLRCNLTMHYSVSDTMRYLERVDAPQTYLYKQLQFAARKHLGNMSIDEILSRQHTLNEEVRQEFAHLCKEIGVDVEGVYIKDIILPGEMREIFNQVIEASKRAEANNIKRREETAATRSLLNTAKLMKDNPALARLKELEALEKITQTVGTLNVYGGLDHVMNGMISLKEP
jgi:regulator of protease activity HflC (stomatin/prohibitin superfamily)